MSDDSMSFNYYFKDIFYLNRLDISNLFYFDNYCQKLERGETIQIYEKLEKKSNNSYVFVGGIPSYHKYESCPKLGSDFFNYKIPESIKKQGEEKIEEFRQWFRENFELLKNDEEAFKMRLQLKYKVFTIEIVNYTNSGFDYVENYTKEILFTRINSLISNAGDYFKSQKDEVQKLIKYYQRKTFMVIQDLKLDNLFGFTEDNVKLILKEYHYMFVEPTKYYLLELIKVNYKDKIDTFELGESLLASLNFKPCQFCYGELFSHPDDNFYTRCINKFGNYEFTKEAGVYNYKDLPGTNFKIAFILSRVLRIKSNNIQLDNYGNQYFKVYIDYVNELNQYCYCDEAYLYTDDMNKIKVFAKYITRVSVDKSNNKKFFQLYILD